MTDSKYPVPVPVPQPEPQEKSFTAGLGSKGPSESLPDEKQILAGKIMGAIGSDADEGTEFIVVALARRLPESSLAKVFESLVVNRGEIKHRARYAVGALQSEFAELAGRT